MRSDLDADRLGAPQGNLLLRSPTAGLPTVLAGRCRRVLPHHLRGQGGRCEYADAGAGCPHDLADLGRIAFGGQDDLRVLRIAVRRKHECAALDPRCGRHAMRVRPVEGGTRRCESPTRSAHQTGGAFLAGRRGARARSEAQRRPQRARARVATERLDESHATPTPASSAAARTASVPSASGRRSVAGQGERLPVGLA